MTPHSGEICVTPLQVYKKPEIGKDQLRGTTDFIRICTFGILLAPHSDQSAISDRFRTTQQRHRQTDRRTDRIGIAIVDLMLMRWHRSPKINELFFVNCKNVVDELDSMIVLIIF